MTTGALRVGCSAWSYRDWRGVVYPTTAPARTWFSIYAAQFDTVELNTTFYRLPTTSTVDGWASQAPPDFTFAVKVGQFGSHRMKLNDAVSWLPHHVERVASLLLPTGSHGGALKAPTSTPTSTTTTTATPSPTPAPSRP